MESDFSDFKKWESRLRGHSVGVKNRKSPFDSEDSHKWSAWTEEVIYIADQVAKGYGIVATDEEIDSWADRLSKDLAKFND